MKKIQKIRKRRKLLKYSIPGYAKDEDITDQPMFNREINWSKYAYVTYATEINYLCSAIMNLAKLKTLYGSKAELVVLYDFYFGYKKGKPASQQKTQEGKLIANAIENYGIKFKSVPILHYKSEIIQWSRSFTKFWVFDQVQYDRIVYFDTDCTVLQNMDELFFIPPAAVALPIVYHKFQDLNDDYKEVQEYLDLFKEDVATVEERYSFIDDFKNGNLIGHELFYYNDKDNTDEFYRSLYDGLPSMKTAMESLDRINLEFELGDFLMVIQPSNKIFKDLLKLCGKKKSNEYDMDIINKYLNLKKLKLNKNNEYINEKKNTIEPLVLILPHNQYGMLSGEFKVADPLKHEVFLADPMDIPLVGLIPQNEETGQLPLSNS
ncbi:unnamed protein product [[Candida] boidinii]|nr:unnamed protein product [[Candida] boidinii]